MSKKLKAIGMFIFAGSASIGVMENGYDVDKILEISDDMPMQNAKHFIHNYPKIPVIIPSIWENEEYLENLKNEKYDLLYANPPCSGLSQLSRAASVDSKVNQHLYRVFDTINKIEPKAFIIENAPTLITLGKPILKDMVKKIEKYNFTIIRDFAGNHNVPMKRQRTLVVGWRKDCFNGVPIIFNNKKNPVNVEETIGDLFGLEVGSKKIPNFNLVIGRQDQKLEQFFRDVKPGCSIRETICKNYNKFEPLLNEEIKKSLATQLVKMNTGRRYWDKSPARVECNGLFPSMSSVANIIHPLYNRPLTVREYARIMGYPDSFEFVDDCETPIVQCIAQGVPVNFFKWISGKVKQALNGEAKIIKKDGIMCQYNNKGFLTKQEFLDE